MSFWGPIIGAGISTAGSLLGGLLGGGGSPEGGGAKKAKHHQLDYDRRRIKAIVDGAKDAGIHPLAALGVSGGGGFASPVGNGGNWLGDAIGSGVGALGDAFASAYESDQDRIERAQERSDRKDEIERQRMDQIAADTIAAGERDEERELRKAEIRRLDSETMLNAARSRSELASMRAAAMGAVTTAPSLPPSVKLPYSGTWRLAPGTSPANDVANVMGEGHENLAWVEQLIYNLLHDPDGTSILSLGHQGRPAPMITRGPNPNR